MPVRKDIEVGTRVYMVGGPYDKPWMATGVIQLRGDKKKSRWCYFPQLKSQWWSLSSTFVGETRKAAVGWAIMGRFKHYCRLPYPATNNPWEAIRQTVAILRMYRKLIKARGKAKAEC